MLATWTNLLTYFTLLFQPPLLLSVEGRSSDLWQANSEALWTGMLSSSSFFYTINPSFTSSSSSFMTTVSGEVYSWGWLIWWYSWQTTKPLYSLLVAELQTGFYTFVWSYIFITPPVPCPASSEGISSHKIVNILYQKYFFSRSRHLESNGKFQCPCN